MRRRRAPSVAWLAVISLLSFTVGPVCGSATDVDAKSCCARHSHSDTDCAGASSHSDQTPNPDKCCQFGHLLYPIAKPQASPAGLLAAGLHADAAPLALPSLFPVATLVLTPQALVESPPRPSGAALYDLTSAYRI